MKTDRDISWNMIRQGFLLNRIRQGFFCNGIRQGFLLEWDQAGFPNWMESDRTSVGMGQTGFSAGVGIK
jgi:hypothetical protein